VELYTGACAASPLTVELEADGAELVPEQDHSTVTLCWQNFQAQTHERLRNILIE